MKVQLVLAPPLLKHRGGELNERITPPLGILYLASYLRQYIPDIDISVVDGQIEGMEKSFEIIGKWQPDILGISVHTLVANGAYELANRVKRAYPETLVIMGGPHCTGVPEDVLRKSSTDLVCIGEGEKTMHEVAETFLLNRKNYSKAAFAGVKGLAYLENEKVSYTGTREFIQNLDMIPHPARDLVDLKMYSGWYVTKRLPETRIISARGCPFHCTFCSCKTWKLSQPAVRVRSPKSVADEIEGLIRDYGIKEFGDDCDEFNNKIENAKQICTEFVRRKLDITWRTQVRAHPLPEDLVKLMAESGCWQVQIGIESGNERTLRGIGKNITLAQVADACRVLRKFNIEVVGMFMLYNVWEQDGQLQFEDSQDTERTMRYGLDLLDKGLIQQVNWGATNPFPGSMLYDIAVKYGLIKKGLLENWEAWRTDELYAMRLPGVDPVEQTRMRTKGQLLKMKQLIFSNGKLNVSDWKFFVQKGFRIVKDEIRARGWGHR
jgi:anaerobic magnesium-protoporphyrin IX monomethyl ester cyclase